MSPFVFDSSRDIFLLPFASLWIILATAKAILLLKLCDTLIGLEQLLIKILLYGIMVLWYWNQDSFISLC